MKLGDVEIGRLGFGAMRITGTGVWGPPADPDEAAGGPAQACRSSAST